MFDPTSRNSMTGVSPGAASGVGRVVWALVLVVAFVASACSSGGEEVADAPSTAAAPSTADVAPSTETPTTAATTVPTAPTAAPTADEPVATATPDQLQAAQPNWSGTIPPEPAPLGAYVVARGNAGERVRVLPGDSGRRAIPVFEHPGGPARTLVDFNAIDGVRRPQNLVDHDDPGPPLVLRVIAGTPDDDWLVVQTPSRPNNSYAWVWRDDFEYAATSRRVMVDLAGEGELRVVEGDATLLTSPIVHGHEDRPTPTGVSYLRGAVAGESVGLAFGHAVVSTAGSSESLGSFGNGVPRTLLHGTNAPEMMGQRVSSGNIRLPDEQLAEVLSLVGPGTPLVVYDSSSPDASLEAVLARSPGPATTMDFDPDAVAEMDPGAQITGSLFRRCGPDDPGELICESDGEMLIVEVGDDLEHVFATARPDAGMLLTAEGDDGETTAISPVKVIPVYEEPGGEPRMLVYENAVDSVRYDYPLRHETVFGEPLVLSVVKMTGDSRWLLVRAPVLPTDRVVWVRAEDFVLSTSSIRIEVDLGYEFLDRTGMLSIWDGGSELLAAKISAGRDTRPTTTTSTHIDQVVTGVAPDAYGPTVFVTPTFSEQLGTFGGGGLPQQVIHALPVDLEDQVGYPTSAGSIHVTGETLQRLVDLDDEVGLVGARVVIYDSSSPSTDFYVVTDRPLELALTTAIDPTVTEPPAGTFT